MPIFEYVCKKGHKTEKVYLTFGEAERMGNKSIMCPVCKPKFSPAKKVEFSVPLPGHFYGAGFYKPSPTKRDSTKVVSKKDGNKYA